MRDKLLIESNSNDEGVLLDEMLKDILDNDDLLMWWWQISNSGKGLISYQTFVERAGVLKDIKPGGVQ